MTARPRRINRALRFAVRGRRAETAVIEGAVQRLRPKLMTVAVMVSFAPIVGKWDWLPRDETNRRANSRKTLNAAGRKQ